MSVFSTLLVFAWILERKIFGSNFLLCNDLNRLVLKWEKKNIFYVWIIGLLIQRFRFHSSSNRIVRKFLSVMFVFSFNLKELWLIILWNEVMLLTHWKVWGFYGICTERLKKWGNSFRRSLETFFIVVCSFSFYIYNSSSTHIPLRHFILLLRCVQMFWIENSHNFGFIK